MYNTNQFSTLCVEYSTEKFDERTVPACPHRLRPDLRPSGGWRHRIHKSDLRDWCCGADLRQQLRVPVLRPSLGDQADVRTQGAPEVPLDVDGRDIHRFRFSGFVPAEHRLDYRDGASENKLRRWRNRLHSSSSCIRWWVDDASGVHKARRAQLSSTTGRLTGKPPAGGFSIYIKLHKSVEPTLAQRT
jgi:hypothetical protein